MKYAVNDVYRTIQGEGAMAGTPMLLVRLHGCAVHCHFCDTKETWQQHEPVVALADALGTSSRFAWVEPEDLALYCYAQTHGTGIKWVLLTGGEPAEQRIRPLVRALHDRHLLVALETSGTARGHLEAEPDEDNDRLEHDCDFVCVSPKLLNPSHLPILRDVIAGADEIKMVIGSTRDLAELDTLLRDMETKPEAIISLQPMSESPKAAALCVERVIERGWTLSVQTHKLISVR